VLAGTYLSKYGQKSKLAEIIRDVSDIMMSAPSIVIGSFVYAVVVLPMGHFSGWAGIIMLPIILRIRPNYSYDKKRQISDGNYY